jgi:sec-independent protein translocase protein TatB
MGFDFGVGYSELFVLAVIAVIVIGPKDLPRVLRSFGQFMRKAKGMAREFQGHVDAAMKDAGVDGLKKDIADVKSAVSGNLANEGLAKTSTPQALSASTAHALSSSEKDFKTYFGEDATPGGTHVAGTKVGT